MDDGQTPPVPVCPECGKRHLLGTPCPIQPPPGDGPPDTLPGG